MIEESLLKSNYIGKDGFSWWIGQVAHPSSWKSDKSKVGIKDSWGSRCKVRIVGYHTFDPDVLPDDDLPWAQIIMDPTVGNGIGGLGSTVDLMGGESCFGFFLDGEDSQQPVVVGLFYRSPTGTVLDENIIAKERGSRFKPFSGHPGRNIPSTQRFDRGAKTAGTQNPAPVPKDPQGNEIVGADRCREPAASVSALEKKCDIEIERVNGCENNSIRKLSSQLQGFISFTNGLEEFSGKYIDPVLNDIVDIQREIRAVAGEISGTVKGIINLLRNDVIKYLVRIFKEILGLPTNKDPIIQVNLSKGLQKIIDVICCIFEKLFGDITPFIEDLLNNILGNVLNSTLCAIDQLVSAILAQIMNLIDDALNVILSGISWLTGKIQSLVDILNTVSSLTQQIFSIIDCFNLKCEPKTTWYSSRGLVNTLPQDLDNIVSGVNNFLDIPSFDDLLGTDRLAIFNIDGVVDGCDNDSLPPTKLGTRGPVCIPPIIDIISSGSGSGASAKPIINSEGKVIGATVITPGSGYINKPTITIIDNSGYGYGAIAEAVINSNGELEDILLKSYGSGYCGNSVSISTSISSISSIATLPNTCVNSMVIIKPGYGYTSGDTLSDGVNTYPVILSSTGSLIGYKLPNNAICGFTTPPTIVINTSTGVGAQVLPIMRLKSNSNFNSSASLVQGQVINVIDCV